MSTLGDGGRPARVFDTTRAQVQPPLDAWTEVLAALSLATDLANGHDYEKTLRSCVLAVGLAEAAGLDEPGLRQVFHATMLRFIGCTSFAHEEALVFGDDIAARQAFATVDHGDKRELWRASEAAMQGTPGRLRRLARRGAAMLRASGQLRDLYASQCEIGVRFGTRLSVDEGAIAALGRIHERWDGSGGPAGLREDALGMVACIVQVATLAELVHRRLGVDAAIEIVGRRGGTALSPRVCELLRAHARVLLAPLEQGSAWDAFLAIGSRFPMIAPAHALDDVVTVFADVADLSSVYTLGHSRAVAQAAVTAAEGLGLPTDELATLRHAALLHDLGRVAVPASIWEKPGPLTAADWERVRLHAYYGERILGRAPVLARVAALARADHERCDGSGYPRGAEASPLAARVLAAADVWCALREDRPHRAAHARERAQDELLAEVKAGRLDAQAVDAVLGRVAAPDPAAADVPAGLTTREIEVLRWVARGDTNKEVAVRLGISPRTVGHHLGHAFEKIGVSTRAAAALFIVENGLLRVDEP